MATTTTHTTAAASLIEDRPVATRLEYRFAALKQEIIKDVDREKLQDSYERLKVELAGEVERLEKLQQDAVPEVEWGDVVANGEFYLSRTVRGGGV